MIHAPSPLGANISDESQCRVSSATDGYLALCHRGPGTSTSANVSFALAFDADSSQNAVTQAQHGLTLNLTAIVAARLQAITGPPALANATLDRLSRKVYSVMRANTLSAEGTIHQHWSTPDRVPHRAMW